MASQTTNTRRLGEGTLYRGVTNLATTSPYGGTELGLCRAARVDWGIFAELPAEETNAPAAILFLGDNVVLEVLLASWDEDARSAIYPNVSATGKNPQWPGTSLVPGAPLSELTDVLFVPKDTSQPAVHLQKACAVPVRGVRVAGRKYLDITVRFHGMPDGSDNVGTIAPIAQVTL